MNKKLLSLAVAAAMVAPAAMAEDITIYGQMHYSSDYIENDAAGFADDNDWMLGINRVSRIGVKGSEDLGNGLKAIFKIESAINGTVGSRNTYVGLSGDWGTLLMGRHDTPYKISTGSLDLFADTMADYNNIIGTWNGSLDFDERAPQTIAYVSPNMSGLTVAAALVSTSLDEGAGAEETEAASIAAMYSNGGLFASLAWEGYNDGALALGCALGSGVCGTAGSESWKAGLGYKADQFRVGAVYESIDAGAGNDQDNWLINGAYYFGNTALEAQYGESDSSVVNGDYDMWTIGLDHKMSKRTSVYALYANMDNDTAGTGSLNCGGDVGSAHCAAGGDQSGFSVGIVHSF